LRGEGGRYDGQSDGLDEADTMSVVAWQGGREGGREGARTNCSSLFWRPTERRSMMDQAKSSRRLDSVREEGREARFCGLEGGKEGGREGGRKGGKKGGD